MWKWIKNSVLNFNTIHAKSRAIWVSIKPKLINFLAICEKQIHRASKATWGFLRTSFKVMQDHLSKGDSGSKRIRVRLKYESKPIGPLTTGFLVRPVASLVAGFLIAIFFLLLNSLFGASILSLWTTFLLGVLLSALFALNDDEPTVVPVAYGAPLTFFGMRIPFWLTEGDYTWIGRKLFIKSFKYSGDEMAKLPNYVPGYIYVGELVLPIWNTAIDENTTLSNVAKDGSTITTNLTVVIQIEDPAEWIGSSQPIFDISERARSSFRTAVAFFVGVDCFTAKTLLGKLMTGDTVITAFLGKSCGNQPKLSMIQDRAGTPLFKHLAYKDLDQDPKSKAREIEKAKEEFWQEIMDKVDEDIWRAAKLTGDMEKDLGTIQDRSIDDHLLDVIEDVGAQFVRVSVGDVSLSEEVEKQANRAAGEVFQRDAQMASARTTREAAKEMLPDEDTYNNPAYQDTLLIGAAQDNPGVKIVHVTGGDSLTKAAVAGALQIGNGGSKS